MEIIIILIHRVFQILMLLVVVDALLSYFMSPYHPVRQALDRLLEPMLAPIRRILPSTGTIDFSPLVLIILLQVLDAVVTGLLYRL